MIRPLSYRRISPRLLLAIVLIGGFFSSAWADTFKITAYCSCFSCCNKSDGITASGKPAQYGYVACNWLPFGTKVNIEGMGTFKVMDHGARSLFGTKKNHIKHLDVWLPSHAEAKRFGVRYKNVEIL